MNTNTMLTFQPQKALLKLTLLLVLFLSLGFTMNAQTPFNGDVQTYMERLPKVIESRYNELAAATDYQEYLSTYIENFLKQETVKGVVFIPDFMDYSSKSELYSLENYMLTFIQQYKSYINEGNIPEFQLSNFKFIRAFWTEDKKGVMINLQYDNILKVDEKVLYKGKSQAVMVFPSVSNIFEVKIRQISPLQKRTLTATSKSTSDKQSKVVSNSAKPQVDKKEVVSVGGHDRMMVVGSAAVPWYESFPLTNSISRAIFDFAAKIKNLLNIPDSLSRDLVWISALFLFAGAICYFIEDQFKGHVLIGLAVCGMLLHMITSDHILGYGQTETSTDAVSIFISLFTALGLSGLFIGSNMVLMDFANIKKPLTAGLVGWLVLILGVYVYGVEQQSFIISISLFLFAYCQLWQVYDKEFKYESYKTILVLLFYFVIMSVFFLFMINFKTFVIYPLIVLACSIMWLAYASKNS